MEQSLVIVVSLVLVLVIAQHPQNEKCKTPSSKDGTCIPLDSCNIIQPLIQSSRSGNRTAYRLVRKYQCGYYNGDVLVCCDFDTDTILSTTKSTPTSTPTSPTTTQRPIILEKFNSKDLPDRSVCGLSPSEGDKIWGGVQTNFDEFPWVAAIEFVMKKNNQSAGIRCGGSLINDRYVVTAAHCMKNSELKIHKVRLGEWNITTDPDCYDDPDLPNPECADPVQLYSVEKEIPHEFHSGRDSSNDIGLLKLDRSVKYSPYIRPICLPPPGLPLAELQTYMTVVGWGLTENDTSSNIKLKVDVPLVSNRVCREKLRKPIGKSNYCAGGEAGKDACLGDSGGPLMRKFRNDEENEYQWFLEGIVGSGIGCGTTGNPGIYVRVTEYTNWIIDTLTEESRNLQAAPKNKISAAFIHFPEN